MYRLFLLGLASLSVLSACSPAPKKPQRDLPPTYPGPVSHFWVATFTSPFSRRIMVAPLNERTCESMMEKSHASGTTEACIPISPSSCQTLYRNMFDIIPECQLSVLRVCQNL